MKKIVIRENTCKGCGLCTGVCPKKILKLDAGRVNSMGYNPAVCIDDGSCISCAFCALICPDVAISVYKEDK